MTDYFEFCDWATKKYNYLSDLDLSQEYIRKGKIYLEYMGLRGSTLILNSTKSLAKGCVAD